MKIIIAGYGRMGREIERVALERGHSIVGSYNSKTNWSTEVLPECDVVVDFSTPDSAPMVVNRCLDLNIPVVSGTTGWNDKVITARERAISEGKTFFYASNFSIGVNIFFEINRKLASFLCTLNEYKAAINETHHIHKKDAPSGTAITIADGILKECNRYESWVLNNNKESDTTKDDFVTITDKQKRNIEEENYLRISSERIGEVPGTHIVTWESNVDSIEIKHTAHSRAGFAYGAVYAAEWVIGKKGVFGMSDLLQLGE